MAKVIRVRNKLFDLMRKKELDEHRKITNKEVATALGVSSTTLKSWLDQNVNQFSGRILNKARDYFGLESINELIDYAEVEEPA